MAVYEATDRDFRDYVEEGVYIVDFYNDHCGPCRMLLPMLLEIESEMPFIKLIKVNTDRCTETADEFKVLSLPTLYLGKDGSFTEYSGGRSIDEIRSAIGAILYD